MSGSSLSLRSAQQATSFSPVARRVLIEDAIRAEIRLDAKRKLADWRRKIR